MALKYIRGSTLLIEYDNVVYPINNLGSISLDTTYNESTYSQKTVFQSSPLANNGIINRQSSSRFSFNTYLTQGRSEDILLGLMGFNNTSQLIGNSRDIARFNLYIVSPTFTYKVPNAALEGMTFSLARGNIYNLEFTGLGKPAEYSATAPSHTPVEKSRILTGTSVEASFGGSDISSIRSISLEITRSLTALNQKSMFDAGTIYSEDLHYVDGVTGGCNLQGYFSDTTTEYSNSGELVIQSTGLDITFTNANKTERVGLAELHNKSYDFRALQNCDFIFSY